MSNCTGDNHQKHFNDKYMLSQNRKTISARLLVHAKDLCYNINHEQSFLQ